MKSFLKSYLQDRVFFFFLSNQPFYALSLQFSSFLILRVEKKLISLFTINFVPNGQKWQVLAFLAFFLILFKYYLNLEQRIDFFKDTFQRSSFRNILSKTLNNEFNYKLTLISNDDRSTQILWISSFAIKIQILCSTKTHLVVG